MNELIEFLRDEAHKLDELADGIDLSGSKQENAAAKAYCDGAAFILRTTAASYRERIPTEFGEYDLTPADLDLGVRA